MKDTFKNGPELALAVVTAATIFTSVVCCNWVVAIGVVLLLDLANYWKKRLDEKALYQKEHRPKVGSSEQEDVG